jgi:hypothetical protein
MAILQVFFAIVAYEDLEYYQYNIKNTFIEAKFTKKLWIKIFKEITQAKIGIQIYLFQSLYGLKQII